ncbi:hypothetical protein, partial [uncultured Marinobacter sp.]|uniref:hypothetical protein n=1 Tax=uncultured Marinobacter sp. TaxID=187379 RepID=UPI0030D8B2A8
CCRYFRCGRLAFADRRLSLRSTKSQRPAFAGRCCFYGKTNTRYHQGMSVSRHLHMRLIDDY